MNWENEWIRFGLGLYKIVNLTVYEVKKKNRHTLLKPIAHGQELKKKKCILERNKQWFDYDLCVPK